jgi:hypothetical protein
VQYLKKRKQSARARVLPLKIDQPLSQKQDNLKPRAKKERKLRPSKTKKKQTVQANPEAVK